MFGLALSNTHAFRHFHRSQAPNMTVELKRFFSFLLTLGMLPSSTNVQRYLPVGLENFRRIPLAIRFWTRILGLTCMRLAYAALFRLLDHIRDMRPGGGGLFFWTRSAIQHLLRIANHKKALHLQGAHDFQINFQGLNVIAPLKNARYADFDVKCPIFPAANDADLPHPPRPNHIEHPIGENNHTILP